MATGAYANVKWGLETTFGTAATNINKNFGYAVEITALDYDNSPSIRRGLGNRNLQAMAFGEFKGSMSMKFDLVDPWVFRIMTGGYVKSGAGPFVYAFAEADVLSSFTTTGYIKNIDGGADTLRTFTGCVVTDYTIDVAVGDEPISISLNIAFAKAADTAATQALLVPTNAPLMFAQAVLKKATVAQTFIENFSIKGGQNSVMKVYLGSRFPKRARFGDREYECSTLHYYQTPSVLFDEAWGAAGGPAEAGAGPKKAWELLITPSAGQTADTVTISFTDGYVVKMSQPMKVGEDIMEEATIVMTTMTVSISSATTEVVW